jgi:hypothetical protein
LQPRRGSFSALAEQVLLRCIAPLQGRAAAEPQPAPPKGGRSARCKGECAACCMLHAAREGTLHAARRAASRRRPAGVSRHGRAPRHAPAISALAVARGRAPPALATDAPPICSSASFASSSFSEEGAMQGKGDAKCAQGCAWCGQVGGAKLYESARDRNAAISLSL